MSIITTNNNGIVKSQTITGNTTILELTGEIEMNCVMQLREAVMEAMQESKIVVLNMTEVKFMDSSGLATMVETLQQSKRQDKQLKIAGLNQRVKSIFEISRLETVFDIYDTEKEALA
ncbi:MAG: STAS domain-containing protein [Phycisphaerae bacterium]|nr:STAS domain-containing protein [Phycisphaerae bacterium]